ncbi:RNA 3'-terminal phosphate cyclase [Mucor velutinosus]|uniref:RNA 3'-terminal phosphate cyclase n=1 Tax=Mucor velutinosus TaxID=708070 RepID=A0AAN7DHU9_9FUNG|nr:RNA 3'-terminal phosphate cyclase [Mucor velutinosus]
MALPDKQTLSKGRDPKGRKATDSRHNATKQKDPMWSYAQILKSDQTRDTFDLTSRNSDELGQLIEGGGGTTVSPRQGQELCVLRSQFPDALGLRIRNVSQTTKYFEINFRTAEARETALKKEFTYEGKQVIVSRTYPKDATIVRVSVSNLPYEDEETLKDAMSTIFGKYGEILEMGLLHTVHGHFFTGRGFVTLNLIPGKEYAPLVPLIDSWESGETLKITYTGMKPTCSRCNVTDHVFGNCPVMSQRVKHCHICSSPNHLQATCPDAWWNQRKKAAKLNTTHTSPHQPKVTNKEAAPVVPTPAKADESTSEKVKDTKPFITEITPASSQESTSTNSNTTVSSSTAEETAPIPSSDVDERDVAATGEEQLTKEVEVCESEQERLTVIQEQQGDILEYDLDDKMDGDDDVDDSDINMEEAAKEAASSSIPLDEVLRKMRRQLRLQHRKAKQLHKDNKDKASRPRHGGTASKKKASTNPSSRQ